MLSQGTVLCDKAFDVVFFRTAMKRFGFCDIQNDQGLSKCFQPQPLASAKKQLPHP